ncbi:TadE family type IV pilus minor pilin [Streptomyces sp. V4-01]|uniref:TadE family type IV pilus minor pilin n=1 Tax=Actinacidiphila polyblastidii TaxID=3110430 RepID=A0ABU7PLJ0_9ACTN|nr:TadE family type IV pilus minor pilin [Streptomyces sp. V4-01]
MSRSESRRRAGAGQPGSGRDQGYVTAESAMVIPMLVALTGLLIWGLMAAAAQVRCVDAARAAARQAARSETPAVVRAAARQAAPSGARISVSRADGLVRVRVVVPAPRFPLTLVAEAAALDEDAVDEGAVDAARGGGVP